MATLFSDGTTVLTLISKLQNDLNLKQLEFTTINRVLLDKFCADHHDSYTITGYNGIAKNNTIT
jgi:hypothetical protein